MPPCYGEMVRALPGVRDVGDRRRGRRPERTGGQPHRAVTPSTPAVPITSVDPDRARHLPTGVDELDRVLGGGVVPGR